MRVAEQSRAKKKDAVLVEKKKPTPEALSLSLSEEGGVVFFCVVVVILHWI